MYISRSHGAEHFRYNERTVESMNIPFHKPWYDKDDEAALVAALRSGKIVGDGENTRRASEQLARLLGVKTALLTPSCSHALELAMMVLRLKPGDEVIVPSFTFVSTTNCVLRQGATLAFADILPTTLTLDVEDVRKRITPRTKAIVPVVYAGVAPEMDELTALAREHNIVIVEDAAQALGASYREQPLGTIGDMGCFSFHETKNLSTGEGGAFVTNNEEYAARAEIIREKGTNRKQFMLHLVDKYTWVDVGGSFLPPDLVGALLCSQLSKLTEIQTQRERIHKRYMNALKHLADSEQLTLPTIPEHTRSNHHIFYVLMKDEETRNKGLTFFKDHNVGATFHYLPLHLAPVGRRLGGKPGDLPVTESVSGRLLRLPIYPALTEAEQEHVVETMNAFFKIH
ncbi:MAG: dTDP-4-amino-4,6-dideoxygalactose transaminase [Bacteroidetes bacterium]|nr:dTDP-4-amino-4,6-dideoxygalactose transaminase [Bacteroidota bacterium]